MRLSELPRTNRKPDDNEVILVVISDSDIDETEYKETFADIFTRFKHPHIYYTAPYPQVQIITKIIDGTL